MKISILFIVLLLGVGKLAAQKKDTLLKANPGINIFSAKPVDQKLVKLRETVKKLETTLNEANALMEELKRQKDSLSELNEQDLIQLQRLMEQKSQLESMISNIMKAAAECQNNINKSLKASLQWKRKIDFSSLVQLI